MLYADDDFVYVCRLYALHWLALHSLSYICVVSKWLPKHYSRAKTPVVWILYLLYIFNVNMKFHQGVANHWKISTQIPHWSLVYCVKKPSESLHWSFVSTAQRQRWVSCDKYLPLWLLLLQIKCVGIIYIYVYTVFWFFFLNQNLRLSSLRIVSKH